MRIALTYNLRVADSEEEAEFDILMLVRVEDVDVVAFDEEIDDGRDQALAVGAVDEQDGGLRVRHGRHDQSIR